MTVDLMNFGHVSEKYPYSVMYRYNNATYKKLKKTDKNLKRVSLVWKLFKTEEARDYFLLDNQEHPSFEFTKGLTYK